MAGLALLGACSSLPDTPEEVFEKRNQASRNLEAGNRYFREARYNEALEFYQLSLDSSRAIDDAEGQVTALNSLGKTFFLAGENDKAADYYDRALTLAQGSALPVLILQSANNIAELQMRRGESAKALFTCREALETGGKEASGTVELAVLYHNMGACLRDEGEFAAARGCVEQAADMNRSAKRFSELASNYYMLSSIAFRENRLDAAQEAALAALDYDKRMENSLGIAQDLLALGTIAQKAGNAAQAHEAYKRSFLAYRALEYVNGMRRSLEKLIATSQTLNLKKETEQYREAYGQLQPET
jgi:tetratricopeptide (TPR) repeat protein